MTEDTKREGGRPKTVEDDVFTEAVKELGVTSTSQVRERVSDKTGWNLDKSTALRRLNSLADSGVIAKRVDGRKAEWMLYETFENVVPDNQFIEAIEELDQLASTSEISEETGYNETTVLKRLQEMERRGKVASRNQDGDGEVIWTLSK